MLVSMAILVVIMAIILSMTQQTSNLWKNTSGKIEGFRNSRTAFDSMTKTISEATLETYFDYEDSNLNWVSISHLPAASYARRSDLHFVSGQGGGSTSPLLAASFTYNSGTYTPVTHAIFFQSPLGYSNKYSGQHHLLNACGFYIAYGPDPNVPSFLSGLSPRYRYRLMEFLQPSESLEVYQATTQTTVTNVDQTYWFTLPIIGPYPSGTTYVTSNYVLSENVVALIVWPKLSAGEVAVNQANGTGPTTISTNYTYDSRNAGSAYATYTLNQMPPVVEVTMVTIDEQSALKLGNTSTPPNTRLGLTSALFTQTSNYQTDLQTLEQNLAAAPGNAAGNTIPLKFRVFQTEVAIAGAKWTAQ